MAPGAAWLLSAMFFLLSGNADAQGLDAEEYCERGENVKEDSQSFSRPAGTPIGQEACERSSCCHWNPPSNYGAGRCWSSIGEAICADTTDPTAKLTANPASVECDGVGVTDLDKCHDKCANSTDDHASSTYIDVDFFKYQECTCQSMDGGETEICKNEPDFGALIAIILVCCCLCFCCIGGAFYLMGSARRKNAAAASNAAQAPAVAVAAAPNVYVPPPPTYANQQQHPDEVMPQHPGPDKNPGAYLPQGGAYPTQVGTYPQQGAAFPQMPPPSYSHPSQQQQFPPQQLQLYPQQDPQRTSVV